MGSASYLALLRGINVGGRNRVPMADLRASLDSAGYVSVETYIQSGNVLFDADGGSPPEQIERDLEAVLTARFGFPLVVVVRSHHDLAATVTQAPDGFGTAPDTYLDDVVFLKAPLTADRLVDVIRPREGVDRVWAGEGVVYVSRLAERKSSSRLSRLASTAEYQMTTIRNWNTTTKLLAMLDARRA